MRLLKYGLTDFAVRRSTLRPIVMDNSRSKPTIRRSDVGFENVTRRSMSLSARNSPRATEPKTRSVLTLYLLQMVKIASVLKLICFIFAQFQDTIFFGKKPAPKRTGAKLRQRTAKSNVDYTRGRCRYFPKFFFARGEIARRTFRQLERLVSPQRYFFLKSQTLA